MGKKQQEVHLAPLLCQCLFKRKLSANGALFFLREAPILNSSW